jgi:hypothetical protein
MITHHKKLGANEYYSVIKKNEKMDGTEDHHVKQNKPDSEIQTLRVFSHICGI